VPAEAPPLPSGARVVSVQRRDSQVNLVAAVPLAVQRFRRYTERAWPAVGWARVTGDFEPQRGEAEATHASPAALAKWIAFAQYCDRTWSGVRVIVVLG
jgi:hypothetical protein